MFSGEQSLKAKMAMLKAKKEQQASAAAAAARPTSVRSVLPNGARTPVLVGGIARSGVGAAVKSSVAGKAISHPTAAAGRHPRASPPAIPAATAPRPPSRSKGQPSASPPAASVQAASAASAATAASPSPVSPVSASPTTPSSTRSTSSSSSSSTAAAARKRKKPSQHVNSIESQSGVWNPSLPAVDLSVVKAKQAGSLMADTAHLERAPAARSIEEEEKCTIRVRNLTANTSEPQLRSTFGAFGDVEHCSIRVERFTSAVVRYRYPECAAAAMEQLQGRELAGSAMQLTWHTSTSTSTLAHAPSTRERGSSVDRGSNARHARGPSKGGHTLAKGNRRAADTQSSSDVDPFLQLVSKQVCQRLLHAYAPDFSNRATEECKQLDAPRPPPMRHGWDTLGSIAFDLDSQQAWDASISCQKTWAKALPQDMPARDIIRYDELDYDREYDE